MVWFSRIISELSAVLLQFVIVNRNFNEVYIFAIAYTSVMLLQE